MRLPRPRFSLRTLVVFVLLVTSGVGLWWHWGPWVRSWSALQKDDGADDLDFSANGAEIVITSRYEEPLTRSRARREVEFRRTYDARTGALVGEVRREKGLLARYTHMPRYWGPKIPPLVAACRTPDGKWTVLWRSRRAGIPGAEWIMVESRTLGDLEPFLGTSDVEGFCNATRHLVPLLHLGAAEVVKSHRAMAAFSKDGKRLVHTGVGHDLHLWHRRHPPEWHGVLWLWEFWLTVAFAGLFVWSVWRDRKALRREAA